LQWGTLVAVIVYFWRDLWAIGRAVISGLLQRQPVGTVEARLGWLIVVATIPAVVIGLLFKDFFEGLHHEPKIVAAILLSAAILIFGSERLGKRTRNLASLQWLDALIIGSTQALALLPGVSRSAATICGGLVRDLERPTAARFSFLMSIPVMLGAGVIAIKDLVEVPNFVTYLPPLALGFVVSAVVGFLSIHWLLGFLAKRPLNIFGWYRVAAGLLCLAIAFLR
jgi:undecaprenyl-diphosphatase